MPSSAWSMIVFMNSCRVGGLEAVAIAAACEGRSNCAYRREVNHVLHEKLTTYSTKEQRMLRT